MICSPRLWLLLTFQLLFSFYSFPVCADEIASPNLQLWVKAEDLADLKNGDRVGAWPDASGQKHHLASFGAGCPTYNITGLLGRPVVIFAGDNNTIPKVDQYLEASMELEWQGATIFVVGKGLNNGGWIDTAPGSNSLRSLGVLQVSGTKCNGGKLAKTMAATPGIELAEITAGYDNEGIFRFTTYAAGKLQDESKDEETVFGVQFSNPRFGDINRGEGCFKGAIAEILIYKGMLTATHRMEVERYLAAKYILPEIDIANASSTPPGAPLKKAPHPAVAGQPISTGLKLWTRADDLPPVDGAPVSSWVNVAGEKQPLTAATPDNRPLLNLDAINGYPSIKFSGNTTAGKKVFHELELPLDGSYPEITIFFVGRNLTNWGLFDTQPNAGPSFRHLGAIQLGSAINCKAPFQAIAGNVAGIATLVVGRIGDKGTYLATFANGFQQARQESPEKAQPVIFNHGVLGTLNHNWIAYNGEIAEVLIYDHALTTQERQQTEQYLAEKYAIALPDPETAQRALHARSVWSIKFKAITTTQSWYGNSFSGKTQWVSSGISDLCVLPDGTVTTTCVWDEPHKEIGQYNTDGKPLDKDGKPLSVDGYGGGTEHLPGKPLGRGLKGGGRAIITDGAYFYAGLSGLGKTVVKIKRLTLDLHEAPWPNQVDWPQFDIKEKNYEIRGLAIINGELFVATETLDEVKIFDIATGQFKRSLVLPDCNGARLTADADGKLWVGAKNGVIQYTPDGKPTGKRIPNIVVGGMCLDNKGLLVIAEDGIRQQVISYDINDAQPREVQALGQLGGVYTGPTPGTMAPDRLLHPTALGVDAAGNIYVNERGLLRSYAPDGRLRWELECSVFCTCADFDPDTDGIDIYSARAHYRYIPGQPAGKDWRWVGYPNDERRFPELSDGSGQEWLMRRLNGHLYRFTTSDTLLIHRQEEQSEIFAPCGFLRLNEFTTGRFQLSAMPKKGRSIWCDRNGNGLAEADEFTQPPVDAKPSHGSYDVFVDEQGGIWQPQDRWGIRYLPLQGFAPDGAPIYDYAKEQWFKRPAEFIQVLHLYYVAETDTMFLTGYTWDHPFNGKETIWGCCGHEAIRYDDWSKPVRRLVCRMPFPEGAWDIRAFSVAPKSNLLFAGEVQNNVLFTYDTRNGNLLGICEPDQELFGLVGWLDIGQGIRSFTRANGETVILCEDSLMQKTTVYRIPKQLNVQ